MDAHKIYERLITQAAGRVGGIEALAERLQLSRSMLLEWRDGHETPDMATVLRILEIVLDG